MDEISLILGITGTGGFAISIILYALSKGMNSKCRSMQMEMSLDIRSVDSDPMKQQIGTLTRGELEEIIIGTLAKHTPALTNTNVIVPQYPSQNKDFEDMLKSTTKCRFDQVCFHGYSILGTRFCSQRFKIPSRTSS